MAELRSFIFLDQLQPQTMCYLGSWVRGGPPRLRMAAQVIEIAPGLDIEPLTDVALKEADVQAGILVVERQFGYLELHGTNDAVRAAGSAVLTALGVSATDALRPRVLAARIITKVDAQHAFLLNRNKLGSMVLPAESLFVLELQPASYAILAANEAEKAAQIKIVDYRMIGATGRVYLAGLEDDVRQAAEAVTALLGEPGMTDSGDVSASRAGLPGSGGLPDSGELRQLVREVLREVLPAATHQPNPMKARSIGSQPYESPIHRVADSPAPGTSPGGAVQPVRLGSDQELHEFVLRILRLAEDPQRRQDLLAGRLRFTLDPAASASGNGTLAPAGPPAATAVIRRVEKGAVTERAVIAAAKAGHRLVLGPGAVLTPLARDKARALGIPVEKER